jgi:hypothetical protein
MDGAGVIATEIAVCGVLFRCREDIDKTPGHSDIGPTWSSANDIEDCVAITLHGFLQEHFTLFAIDHRT